MNSSLPYHLHLAYRMALDIHSTKHLFKQSSGLRTTQAEAERVKKELGKAIEFSTKDANEKIEI